MSGITILKKNGQGFVPWNSYPEFYAWVKQHDVYVGDKKVDARGKLFLIWVATRYNRRTESVLNEHQSPWKAIVQRGASNTLLYIKPSNIVLPIGIVNKHEKNNKNNIGVVTYNLSFAVSLHQEIGSEASFVATKCKPHEPWYCRSNAIRSLLNFKYKHTVSIYGFQEYRPWSKRTSEKLYDVEGNHILHQTHEHVMVDTNDKKIRVSDLFDKDAKVACVIACVQKAFYSAVMTCWNQNELGTATKQTCFNIGKNSDLRPCHIILTSKSILIINLHAPQPEKYNRDNLIKSIEMEYRKMTAVDSLTTMPTNIILMGDFNDSQKPRKFKDDVTIFNKKLAAPEAIKACCWDPGFGMNSGGTYNLPGDYVMSTFSTEETIRILPRSNKTNKDQIGRSDHDPVYVLLKT